MLGWRGITILIGAANAILLARWLGPADRGTLAVYVLSAALGTVVLQLGIPEALIYLIGTRTYVVRDVVVTALAYCLVIGSIAGGGAYIVLTAGFEFVPLTSALLSGSVVLSMLLSTVRHVLLGEKRFVAYSLSGVLEAGLYLAALALLWSQDAVSVTAVLVVHVVSIGASALVALRMLQASGSAVWSWKHVRLDVLRACMQRGFHLFLVGLSGFGVQRINYFALEAFTGSRAVGLFTAASTIPQLVANLPQQLAVTLYSHVSNRSTANEGAEVTTAITSALTAFFLLMLFPLWLLAEPLVDLLFGGEFSGIGGVMVVLTVSMMFSGLGSLLFNSLAGSGQHAAGSRIAVLNLVVLCAAAGLLIPAYGLEGAAWAQFIANFIKFAYIAFLFCRSSQTSAWSLLVVSPTSLAPLFRRGQPDEHAVDGDA